MRLIQGVIAVPSSCFFKGVVVSEIWAIAPIYTNEMLASCGSIIVLVFFF